MIRSRIAPTPSGFLHLGNAYNFVLTWLLVRMEGGKLLLRIDDLDAPRIRQEYIEDIFRTLDWLGLDWDEGPQSPEEHTGLYSQQYRVERYGLLLNELIARGKVFACPCSRKELESRPGKLHTADCISKNLALDTAGTALRLSTAGAGKIEFNDKIMGALNLDIHSLSPDPIVRRRDLIPAYHIASLADDADNNINLIVRGEDLLLSTAIQIHIAHITGNISFSQTIFYHHKLIRLEGEKLSKSAGSASIHYWRESGAKPADFYRWFSKQAGLNESADNLNELLGIIKTRPVFGPGL